MPQCFLHFAIQLDITCNVIPVLRTWFVCRGCKLVDLVQQTNRSAITTRARLLRTTVLVPSPALIVLEVDIIQVIVEISMRDLYGLTSFVFQIPKHANSTITAMEMERTQMFTNVLETIYLIQ
uniref:(northern house mosquito) hypothetical protein n=1 Tax=Culex pipiens TaxID=7175 RepID=A0A8D8N602_CULPI